MPKYELTATRRETYRVEASCEENARALVRRDTQAPDRWDAPIIDTVKVLGPTRAERPAPGDPIEDV